ncbi:MAG: hypothetical protein AABX51_07730 [Nanoarchaeota archaeon]
MKKYLFIIMILLISGCFRGANIQENLQNQENNLNSKNESLQNDTPRVLPQEINQQESLDATYEAIKSQLNIALKSGGITPEAYGNMENQIGQLGNQGYDAARIIELRSMLSRLSVGGQPQTNLNPNNYSKPIEKTSAIILWGFNGNKWVSNGVPPACPDPFVFQSPVDLNLVSSILYPGQVRGGDFKPHGGFRTDGALGPIEVKAPLDGYIVDVAKFNDENGINYVFDVQHPCGIMYRFGHLGAVPPKLEAIFNNAPKREFGDSRTFAVEPVFVKTGETIATNTQKGTGFDWGVYDLRKENDASKDPQFREAHKDEISQAYYAFCWFDYLPSEQENIVRGLPAADGKSGKNSDYCK